MPAETIQRFADQRRISGGPRRDRALVERLRAVRHDPGRVKVVDGAQPLADTTGPLRRVEREHTRRELRHADTAAGARELPGEQPVATPERVDDHDIVGKIQGEINPVPQPPLDAGADDQPVDEYLDIVVPAPLQFQVLVERSDLPVHTDLREAPRPQGRQLLLELTLAPAHDRRQHVDPLVGGTMQHDVEDPVDRLAGDRMATLRTVRDADIGEEQTEIVVDLGDGPDGGARVGAGGLLLDRDGRRQALDQIDIGLLDLLEELPRVGRQRLDVAPLPFRIDGIEGERRLTRPGETGHDDQTVTRQADVNTLQIVDAGAAHLDAVVSHGTVTSRLDISYGQHRHV